MNKTPIFGTLADTCDVAYAVNLIGGKWKISIIWELADGRPKRLSELRRNLVGISEGVLIAQLKALEKQGLVIRKQFPVVPPKVVYRLSEQAAQLVPVLRTLEAWGNAQRRTRQQK